MANPSNPYYYAPIQLSNPLYEGMIISGTITGQDGIDINVSGEVSIDGNNHPDVSLYDSDDMSVADIIYDKNESSYIFQVSYQPTQAINVNLVQNGITRKIIPKEYLDVSTIEKAANTAQTTANNAQTEASNALRVANAANTSASQASAAAANAQSTANAANDVTSKISSNPRNYNAALFSKKGQYNWFNSIIRLYYNETNGYFYKNVWESTTPISAYDIAWFYVYQNIQLDTGTIDLFMVLKALEFLDTDNVRKYRVEGVALGENGIIYKITSNNVAADKTTGIHMTASAFPSLPAVTADNNGQFLRVVDGTWKNGDLIVNSSTPDSTKKFRITVNDAGTISATEVTT